MSELPITPLLPEILATLEGSDELVLEAPPGAGKTTLVPLTLLQSTWLGRQKILLLEPRRLAARAAAERMAGILGERPGDTVGYRVRLQSKVSANTRIEVITEGILTRMLTEDPSLEGVGLVIFDEFHERSLEADLGLTMCLESRNLFSDLRDRPLKLLVMSATLDGSKIATLLKGAPLLRSEGRQYPVAVHFCGAPGPRENPIERLSTLICNAWHRHSGSILVFLPGQAEIARCECLLRDRLPQCNLLYPLYGNLRLEEQRRAILPGADGQRKIVLSTALAESSLTIEGISVVVDSGLQRVAEYDATTAMNRLHTTRVSQASAAQRSGRAGRLQEGDCYRMWSETDHATLAEFSEPEIVRSDLTGMVLQLLRWGSNSAEDLAWPTQPPTAHYRQAQALLHQLGALDTQGKLTAHGAAMADLPVHPRLAHMLLNARELDAGDESHSNTLLACELACLIGERSSGDRGSDIELQLSALRDNSDVARRPPSDRKRLREQLRQYQRLLQVSPARGQGAEDTGQSAAVLLGLAYPDRIALQRRSGSREYQLSNGRSARLAEGDALCNSEWLVVAEVGGRAGRSHDTIFQAAALDETAFSHSLSAHVEEREYCDWDDQVERFVAERRHCIGALVWRREPLTEISTDRKSSALLKLVRRRGLKLLNWTDTACQLRARVEILRALGNDAELADMSEAGLLANLEVWLQPFLGPVGSMNDLAKLDCEAMLLAQLTWQQRQYLDSQLPERLRVPSGSRIRIDYRQSPPVLAVKLQEMFGCEETPLIAEGRLAVTVHLLSPAGRPLQITQDLEGFWKGSYQQVKKEMKGRYPRHPWPDNPLQAIATARTKKHL